MKVPGTFTSTTGTFTSTKEIFYNQYIFETFKPLSKWTAWSHDLEKLLEEDYLSIFLNAFEQAIRGYFNQKKGYKNADVFWGGFHNIETYLSSLMFMQFRNSKELPEPAQDRLGDITMFLGETVPTLIQEAVKKGGTKGEDHECTKRHQTRGFACKYAESLFVAIEKISHVDMEEWRRRDHLISLTGPILGISPESGTEFDHVRKCLLKFIWEKIEKNIERGYYPPLLRDYLIISDHFFLFPKKMFMENKPSWMNGERDKVIDFLEERLRPEIEKSALMADDKTKKEEALLPKSYQFNREKCTFQYRARKGDWKDLEK